MTSLPDSLELRKLDDRHSAEFFDCGYGNNLGAWLHTHAHDWARANVSAVWVLSEREDEDEQWNQVLGFFALSATQVHRSEFPRAQFRGEQVQAEAQIPAFLLGKFAVDMSYHGTGLAEILMGHVFAAYMAASRLVGSKFLVLDPGNAKLTQFYRERHGFQSVQATPEDGRQPMMFMPTPSVSAKLDQLRQELGTMRWLDESRLTAV